MRPTIQVPPGCEAEFGDPVKPCNALIRVEEREGWAGCECCDSAGWEPYTVEIRCGRVPHNDDAHDERAKPVVWRKAEDIDWQSGRTYAVRILCRDMLPSETMIVRVASERPTA